MSQAINRRSQGGDLSPPLGAQKQADCADARQRKALGERATFGVIDQQLIGADLNRQGDGLGFSGVDRLKKLRYTSVVIRRLHDNAYILDGGLANARSLRGMFQFP